VEKSDVDKMASLFGMEHSTALCSLGVVRTHLVLADVQAWHGVLLSQRNLRLWHWAHAIGVRGGGRVTECWRAWRRRISLERCVSQE